MKKRSKISEVTLHFDSNEHVRLLLGIHDEYLKIIEEQLGLTVLVKGTVLKIMASHQHDAHLAEKVLRELYTLVKRGLSLDRETVRKSVSLLASSKNVSLTDQNIGSVVVTHRGHMIIPRSVGQKSYIEAIKMHDMIFGVGPAGTGKTFLAMACAVAALQRREYERIILTRPAVEAGEKLGFLPGGMIEKVNPYLRPLYDALHDMVDIRQAEHFIQDGRIEVAPLAFMRGRTLNSAFVILDEAQNCTPEQMKMFLTRLGFNSKVIITADITQVDLPSGTRSGMVEVERILKNVPGICFHYLNETDVVRHPLVGAIIRAYEEDAKYKKGPA